MTPSVTGEDLAPPLAPGTARTLAQRFLPALRTARGKPAPWVGGGSEPDGTLVLAQPRVEASVGDFLQALHRLRVIYPFDWPAWSPRAEALLAPGGIEGALLDELRRLLTVIIRQDRFATGVVAEMVERGVFVRILERMAELADPPR